MWKKFTEPLRNMQQKLRSQRLLWLIYRGKYDKINTLIRTEQNYKRQTIVQSFIKKMEIPLMFYALESSNFPLLENMMKLSYSKELINRYDDSMKVSPFVFSILNKSEKGIEFLEANGGSVKVAGKVVQLM